jgi:hypothetical protein
MKTKFALMTAVLAFSYTFAQEAPLSGELNAYSKKVDSIVVSEKTKMNAELDEVDKNYQDKKIASEERQKQRTEIAARYEKTINEKVNAEQNDLENATKEIVKNAVLGKSDTIENQDKNEVQLGFSGIKMKVKGDKKEPKDYLHSLDLNISFVGANLTSKDEPFRFYSKASDVRTTVYNSYSIALRYEDQVGGFRSPVFYRIGLGMRSDNFRPKYNQVFSQEDKTLVVKDFTKGNLRDTRLSNTYIYVPVDLRFVLNPKYIEYNGVKYLDNRKPQLNIIAGVYGGVRAGSVIYNKYSTEYTKRITERERVMHGMNDIIFGAKLGIGYGGFNLFIQKDLTPTFNDNAQLKKKYGLQVGIEIANVNF